jgi:methylglutaconyl-CoA hydratase
MYSGVRYTIENGIARITLNRPDKRNALNAAMIGELKNWFREAANDGAVRVVVLAGAGKDFCSGADLEALERVSQAGVLDNMADARNMAELFIQMRNHPRPVIAAVHGRALAGGCGLATACDVVLASESARFGYPEVNIGFIPAMVMAILRRSVGEKAAFELITMGRLVAAPRMAELGVVQSVFPDGDFERCVAEYAAELASKSSSAVALSKRLLYHMDSMSFENALEAGVQANAIARQTEDCRRGVEKFLAKG